MEATHVAAPTPLDLLTWSLGSLAFAPIIFGEEFGTEDNLGRLAFTGHVNGAYPVSSLGPSMLGEALVLVGIVVTDTLWRKRPGRVPVREASAVQAVAVRS